MPASAVWSPPLSPVHPGGLARPRIAIAGIAIESSTFSPHISGWDAFTVRRGEHLRDQYPFLAAGAELGEAADWFPAMHGQALPGGAVDAAVYTSLRDEIAGRLASEGPFDGLFLDIHGAMSVVGMQDAEADLARTIRDAVGPDTLISAAMDLHGNVSADLSRAVDLITCYRMAPHEDVVNTRERAVHNLLERLRGPGGRDPHERRPWQAWVQAPVLLPGEKTSTRVEPARSLYERIPEIEAMPGVVDAAIWIGYAWADEPRCQAAIVVTGDDVDLIAAKTAELAKALWTVRREFVFVAPTGALAECLDQALARRADAPRPFVISDSGDNPTAGGAGDVSWTLGELLARPELRDASRTVIHASIFDPEAVAEAVRAGVGRQLDVEVGGRIDRRVRGPVRMTGEVFSISDDPVAGTVATVRSGAVHAIITERRKPYHLVSDFTSTGLDPRTADIVVVKIGYLEPELYEMAADWRLALTPGGVDQDLVRLGHAHIRRPVFPFDPDMPDPDLRPTIRRRDIADRFYQP